MVDEPFTAYYNTPNKSIRQNVARRGVVLHHAAMTNLNELIRLEMGAKQVSSNATCKDEQLPEMFDTDGPYRAWSLSDAYWDSALRSVETCNESTIGWTVSDASHWSLARAVAYWAVKDGFYPHRNGDPKTWTVIGHREVYTIHGGSYGTACPGSMDLDLVTRRAQQILGGSNPAGGDVTPIENEEEEMSDKYMWYEAGGVQINAIFNTISGYFQEFESNVGSYNTMKVRGHGVDTEVMKVSESDFRSVEAACKAVREGRPGDA